MRELYRKVGISRQAHHQAVKRQRSSYLAQFTLVNEVINIRRNHPRMGLRKIYYLVQPEGVGRDQFEQLMAKKGLKLTKTKNYRRTTFSQQYHIYPNLISSRVVERANQVWVSDITYYQSQSRFYYLTFITDVYTRKIVGWAVSDTLHAKANVEALGRALKEATSSLHGLIHHSDRGIQYIATEYVKILKENNIQISMGNKAWENAHAERINGIIKNEYLEERANMNMNQLTKKVENAVNLYNNERPHWRLPNFLSPKAFERANAQNKVNYTVKINY